jgi:hypothetical protein
MITGYYVTPIREKTVVVDSSLLIEPVRALYLEGLIIPENACILTQYNERDQFNLAALAVMDTARGFESRMQSPICPRDVIDVRKLAPEVLKRLHGSPAYFCFALAFSRYVPIQQQVEYLRYDSSPMHQFVRIIRDEFDTAKMKRIKKAESDALPVIGLDPVLTDYD